jgi:hypothetical protein
MYTDLQVFFHSFNKPRVILKYKVQYVFSLTLRLLEPFHLKLGLSLLSEEAIQSFTIFRTVIVPSTYQEFEWLLSPTVYKEFSESEIAGLLIKHSKVPKDNIVFIYRTRTPQNKFINSQALPWIKDLDIAQKVVLNMLGKMRVWWPETYYKSQETVIK